MKQLIISGAMLISMVSCVNHNSASVIRETKESIPVKVENSVKREYIPSLELSGTAFADKEANLGAALPGRVEKIYFPEGSRVNKGDLLVSLSGELYTQALTEYNTVEKDFERVTRLNEKGSISSQDFDHVKAMYEASEAKVRMMKKNAEIVAPFSGTITEYLVQEGENYFFNLNLDPGYSSTSGILRLMKLDPLQVEAEVNEKDLAMVKAGQKAQLTFDAIKDTVFRGEISSVKAVLSTLTHTSTIRIKVDNHSGIIKPGMFAHVKIEFNPISSVAVPVNAIYRQPGLPEEFLFIAENNSVRRQKTERLWTDGTWAGVTGINPGMTVVTSGKEKLQDGSAIEIK